MHPRHANCSLITLITLLFCITTGPAAGETVLGNGTQGLPDTLLAAFDLEAIDLDAIDATVALNPLFESSGGEWSPYNTDTVNLNDPPLLAALEDESAAIRLALQEPVVNVPFFQPFDPLMINFSGGLIHFSTLGPTMAPAIPVPVAAWMGVVLFIGLGAVSFPSRQTVGF